MIQLSSNSTHELARDAALRLARNLSQTGAFEVWRVMQLLNAGAPITAVPGNLLKLAEMLHSYPEVCDYMAQAAEGGIFRTDEDKNRDH